MRSDDVIGAPVKDFTDGIDLRKYRKERADAHKWAQMEIINRHNPMMDDVHAGIRTVDDIKSFDQIVEEARREGADIYPDMNMELFDDAARMGKITVYSSYPIREGVFVSPSRMNAEDYAGGGKVYSKTVAVDDVAWIAPDQGQYARVGDREDAGARFMREDMPFTERRVTTLERLENRRAELLADRENIANFEDRLRAVDDAIAEYEATDHVAATMAEGAESDAHLRAVEDTVYDIQRKLNIVAQTQVVRNGGDMANALRDLGVKEIQLEGFFEGHYPLGAHYKDSIIIRADGLKSEESTRVVYIHEQAHYISSEIFGPEELLSAADEMGSDYMNERLKKRDESYLVDEESAESMIKGADEMVSRGVDILQKRGLLQEYIDSERGSMNAAIEYMEDNGVPDALKDLIIKNIRQIKLYKYGTDNIGRNDREDTTIRSTYNGRDGKGRRLGDVLDKREGADGAISGGGDERGGGSQEGRPGVRNIERPRFSFTPEDSVSKKSKQEQLIDRLRQAIRDERNDVRTAVKLVGRTLRRQLDRDLVDAMGKRDFDNIVRRIEEATVRRDAELPLRKIAETVLDLEIKRKRDAVEKLLDLRVQGETPRGVSIAANVDDKTREFFDVIRDNRTRPAEEVAAMLEEKGGSLDAKMGAALLDNYQAAQRYEAEIAEIGKEIEALRKSNTQLRRERIATNKEGRREDAAAL